MRRLAPAAILALAACRSSAPASVQSAVINTALAIGAAAVERANGGCYAVCTHGTVCNPKTGLCQVPPANEVCQEAPGGGTRCVPFEIGAKPQGAAAGGASGIGISPATGTVPPPPNDASPRRD